MRLHTQFACLFVSMLFCQGCNSPAHGSLTVAAPAQESIFKVTEQPQQRPKVVIANAADVALRLLLNDPGGKLTTLDVPAHSTRSVEVGTQKYEAKIVDPAGKIKGLSGVVWPKQYRQYRADFTVGQDTNTPPFFIGDK